ncbi:MAG: type III pantothenate kinase [Lachnospiraceae bacterium]
MLLAVDVGNTNITMGLFREDDLIATFRMTTKLPRTSDEYGALLIEMIRSKGVEPTDIDAVIVASVVPNMMHSFGSAIIKYFNKKPIVVGPGIKTGIRIATENPKEIGADRIVDVAAAHAIYGGPVLVLDFGTATTYDLVTEDGSFVGGVIAPGIRLCADALWNGAAKLPQVEIRKPEKILAKETISGMQAGLVYGHIGQTEYIIQRIKEESDIENLKTVATGGLGKMIADATEMIDIYDPDLTLKGLNIIYKKQ